MKNAKRLRISCRSEQERSQKDSVLMNVMKEDFAQRPLQDAPKRKSVRKQRHDAGKLRKDADLKSRKY